MSSSNLQHLRELAQSPSVTSPQITPLLNLRDSSHAGLLQFLDCVMLAVSSTDRTLSYHYPLHLFSSSSSFMSHLKSEVFKTPQTRSGFFIILSHRVIGTYTSSHTLISTIICLMPVSPPICLYVPLRQEHIYFAHQFVPSS